MWRVLAALLVVLAFGATLAYGGHAMGAWEAYKPVPDKAGTRMGVHPRAAKHAKAHRKGVKAARVSRRSRPPAPTWADRANAVCRRARPNLELLARELAAARSLEELEAALLELVQMNERVNARIEAIPPPRRQHHRVRVLHRLLADDERLVARMLVAVRRRDESALRATIAAADAVVRRENELFWVLGANECTSPAYLGDAAALA
jgi:hypothetical protein